MKNELRFFLYPVLAMMAVGLAACSRTSTPVSPLDLNSSHDGAADIVDARNCHAYGWAVDANQPASDLQVRVLVDDAPVSIVTADQYRLDLDTFKKCETCAFDVDLFSLVTQDEVHLVLVQAYDAANDTWVDLENSPRNLTCSPAPALNMTGEPEITQDNSGRVKFQRGSRYLILEFLDDDLLHFEFSGQNTQTDLGQPLHTSPMVAKTDYPGPDRLTSDGQGTFETDALKVQVDPLTLCLTAWDTTPTSDLLLTTLCPLNLGQENQGVSLTPESYTNVYGLGEAFSFTGATSPDWVGKVRSPGSVMGNAMVGFNGGGVGNAQFPVAYFTGPGMANYALFADSAYAQQWTFQDDPWQVSMDGDWMRFYLMTGPNLPDLRTDYLELVGTSPIPPRKMLGLWVSEYGYDNWGELDEKLSSLRASKFPVDGFVLDLQWFGGVQSGSDFSQMGSLDWDLVNFPNPAGKITSLRNTQGVGIMTIEEPYISRGLEEYTQLADQNFLARACSTCPPSYLTSNPWWGQGGMVDWTNPDAAAYWHDLKREPLIDAGVIGHWTDLGEPEMYDPASWYFGILDDYLPLQRQVDIHNLYNLLWSQSVYEGYVRNGHDQRPFIMSRSGTSGSQRYGVTMWSGDIGSNMTSLNAQMVVQANMSLSGMDYFGSDIGGFHRGALDGDLNVLYTQWFANSSLLDIPVRPHTENLCNCKDTAPDRIGSLASNLANIRLRYTLIPYLYSLSHRAYLYGEPVYPPLVYYYQADLAVRDIADEKMIGANLLLAQTASYDQAERRVYFPEGDWYEYYSNALIHSTGQQLGPFPLYQEGRFQIPLFARAGALIPQMYVDEKTMNSEGLRSDGSVRDELIVRVYAGTSLTSFTLYEDDGVSTAYQTGAVRTTLLSQQQTSRGETVTIAAAEGEYDGALSSRDNVVLLVIPSASDLSQVSLNGTVLDMFNSLSDWEHAVSGWYAAGNDLIMVKSGQMPVNEEKVFEFR